jgi:hypothetical protein
MAFVYDPYLDLAAHRISKSRTPNHIQYMYSTIQLLPLSAYIWDQY